MFCRLYFVDCDWCSYLDVATGREGNERELCESMGEDVYSISRETSWIDWGIYLEKCLMTRRRSLKIHLRDLRVISIYEKIKVGSRKVFIEMNV